MHIVYLRSESGTESPNCISQLLMAAVPFVQHFLPATLLKVDSVFRLDKPQTLSFRGLMFYLSLLFLCGALLLFLLKKPCNSCSLKTNKKWDE